ncbi:MAG: hypothetical protein KJP00_08425 [Bacteroidia bacterium]|nr:hypothetical protein [Bacteroidia bacterium]
MTVQNKRPVFILIGTAILLLIPLLAMQFTNEVNWSLGDFAIAAILLLVAGFAIDVVIRKVKNNQYRMVITVAIVILFLLIWAELGVGIFGTSFAGS